MSNPTTNKTFTLDDLAKIALGAPELTNEHLSVLQSLLIILLQKFNCHNESVRIQGFPAKFVQKLLNEATDSCQYNFQLHKIKRFQEKYELLEELERKIQDIDSKMEQHFEQIRNCHKTNLFAATMWDFYAASNEDLCTLYMKHNREFCLLARNSAFNKEIRSRVSQLMVERLKEFEAKIEGMQSRLKEILHVVENATRKEKCFESIVKDIEDMRWTLEKNNQNFRETMSETQDMLNCKLDRVALPALKKYLEQCFGAIKEHLRVLKIESSKCSTTKPLAIEDKNTCLSCGRAKGLELFPQFQALKSVDDTKCFCSNLLKEPTILERMDRMKMFDNKVVDPSMPNSFAHCIFRQSGVKKKQMKLQSHGILTNYGSSSTMPQQNANKLPALKTNLKKQQESGLKEENSIQVFATVLSKKSETPLHNEISQNMPAVLSRQNSKFRSVRLSKIYFGN